MDCLDDNAATEFVTGALSKVASGRVEGHLAGCRDCRALVAALAEDGGNDSDVQTQPHARDPSSPSQVSQRPKLGIGNRVGRYLVLSTLGAGGMGVVFAAYDPQLDRKVALKLLRAGLGVTTVEARSRLKREAQAIAQLSHPNVVAVYDVGTIDDATGGDIYVAMEFVEGDTLTAWLKRWPRSWREIVEVFVQAGRGLLAAHSVGLLHRDFKPDNVLVGADGRVRVGDFGLARSLFEPLAPEDIAAAGKIRPLDQALTRTGTVLGTPRYMAPEQLTGSDVDARSDQFSFCVALYEALYSQHPLTDATSEGMLARNDRALPPPEGPKVPGAIARVALRGLERERTKRFASMQALLAELAITPPRSPLRMISAIAAAVALVAGATAVVVARSNQQQVATPNDTVDVLLDRLNAKEEELRVLIHEIERLKLGMAKDQDQFSRLNDQLSELTQQIEQKDREIDATAKELAALKAPKVSALQAQNAVVNAAIQDQQHNVVGCFDEWHERNPDHDLSMTIELEVRPTGQGDSAHAVGAVDSLVLPECVAGALARAPFPPGPDLLDLSVLVEYRSGGVILTPKITGRRVPHDVDFSK